MQLILDQEFGRKFLPRLGVEERELQSSGQLSVTWGAE